MSRYSGRQAVGKINLKLRDKEKKVELAILAYEPELILYRKDEGLEYHFPLEAGKRLLRPQQAAGGKDTKS